MPAPRHAIAAIIGTALFSAIAGSAEPDVKDIPKLIEDLKKVTSELKDLKDRVERTESIRGKQIVLETQIDLIEKEIAEIKKKLGSTSTSGTGSAVEKSLKPDTKAAESLKGMGRIRVVNDFSEEMAVVINNKSHRLLPGEEKLVPVQPGTFTYRVLQVQRSVQERVIAADETKTVRIYPLP